MFGARGDRGVASTRAGSSAVWVGVMVRGGRLVGFVVWVALPPPSGHFSPVSGTPLLWFFYRNSSVVRINPGCIGSFHDFSVSSVFLVCGLKRARARAMGPQS